MGKQSNIEKFLALSDADKQAEVQRAVKAKSRPLTPRQRANWKNVQSDLRKAHQKKLRGRPVTGDGVKVISLSVEQRLLARADAMAKLEGISRAALVARGLEAILAR